MLDKENSLSLQKYNLFVGENMLSKNTLKLIRSLEQKKYRKEHGLFLAEGDKLVDDLLPYFACHLLVGTEEWLIKHTCITAKTVVSVTPQELSSASLLRTPQHVLALFQIPEETGESHNHIKGTLSLALDGVQDPGNMGTIIRLADWFGIKDVWCSQQCADVYAPKTIQATMGAIARVRVHYVDLPEWLKQQKCPVYGTFLDGENVYDTSLTNDGIIVMGSEGRGISSEVRAAVSHKLLIPNYPEGVPTSESLNVSTATAIVCAEFRRRIR